MVDVSEKTVTFREAIAHGIITMNAEAFAAVESGIVKKGDVLGVARIAGIMAVSYTHLPTSGWWSRTAVSSRLLLSAPPVRTWWIIPP